MVQLREGQLVFTFEGALNVYKFDEPQTHQISAMKAVDFIVEFPDYYLFVEVKDPDNTTAANPEAFRVKMTSGKLENDLKYKYRDSFLYQWASDRIDKPIKYVVLLEMSALQDRQYQVWTDKLKKVLPVGRPTVWQKQIVKQAWVMNMATWNSKTPFGSVRRQVGA